jgi:hypothetical protein
MATDPQETPPPTEVTGETPAPPTSTTPDVVNPPAASGAKAPAPAKKAAAPKTRTAATAAKGTTGDSTTTTDGTPVAATIAAASQALSDVAAGFTTVTGSDAEQGSKVYQGEPPMSPEDRYKASQGFDPLTVAVPDNTPYGNMGLPHMAKKTDAPIGPTGNVPTGAAHATTKEAATLVKPLTDEQKKKEKE